MKVCEFEVKVRTVQALGSLDDIHIPISYQTENEQDYICCK